MSNTLSFWNTLAIELDEHIANIAEFGDTGVSESLYLLHNLNYFARAFSNIATHNNFKQKYHEKLIKRYKESLMPYFYGREYIRYRAILRGDVKLESPF